jgi:glycosyltransferase involved in cell wall biosynthesis
MSPDRPRFGASVSLLAWGLNEEALLPGFFAAAEALLDSCLDDYEIVFVNDGSTDRTGAIADAAAQRNPRIRVLHHVTPQNVGRSFLDAVGAARKDIILWQTVDWSFDLRNLRIFLELLHRFDVVVGVRPVPERLLSRVPLLRSIYRVRSRSDTLGKAVISLGNYYLVRILFGVHFHDFQSVMLFRRDWLQALPLRGRTPFLGPEMLIRSYWAGKTFIEVPVPFLKRKAGEAKGTRPLAVFQAAWDQISNWLTWGIAERMAARSEGRRGSIVRVYDPFTLDDDTLSLVLPLFKDFRDARSLDAAPPERDVREDLRHRHEV